MRLREGANSVSTKALNIGRGTGNAIVGRRSTGSSRYSGSQAIAAKMLSSHGWGPSEMDPLVHLWNRESGWRTSAYNPSGGAYEIPQALPSSKLASAGSDWRTSASTQIRWDSATSKTSTARRVRLGRTSWRRAGTDSASTTGLPLRHGFRSHAAGV